jgi:H-NS histone family
MGVARLRAALDAEGWPITIEVWTAMDEKARRARSRRSTRRALLRAQLPHSAAFHIPVGTLLALRLVARALARCSHLGVGPRSTQSCVHSMASKLRSQIDAALSSKVVEACPAVQGQLDRLSTHGLRLKGIRGDVRGPVAPKYRKPANPGETWAGRGLKPRWLAAALKSGKKLEHFSIAVSEKEIQVPKKTRKK